jgi:triacylglycerol lipase
VHVAPPSWASREERVHAIWDALVARGAGRGDARFHLVCYAVGGLDCRALVSGGGVYAGDAPTLAAVQAAVASVTTIATPHRGTRVADAALLALESGSDGELVKAVTGLSFAGAVTEGALHDALAALTLTGAKAASARWSDPEGMLVQSFAGVSHPLGDAASPSGADVQAACGDNDDARGAGFSALLVDHMQPTLVVTAPFGGASLDAEGNTVTSPTDGMVSVESAKWGSFRGCVPSDHYQVIGQLRRAAPDVYTGFDPLRFYAWIASDLAGRGL